MIWDLYYYLKQKVSLGDIIDFKGLKVEVTDNLIKSNPDLFVVEEEYPEYVECIKTVSSNYTLGKIYRIINYDYYPKQISIIGDKGHRNDIYYWTEEYLKDANNCFKPSTPEAAEDWLAKNKPKDLQYYEDLLLHSVETIKDYTFAVWDSTHYEWLKNKEPKLYWLKVLELVQQDLDDGWKPSWSLPGQPKFRISCRYIDTVYRVTYNYDFVEGFVFFKTKQSAEKAIELMEDKLDIIFK